MNSLSAYAETSLGRSERPLPRGSKAITRKCRAKYAICAFQTRECTRVQVGSAMCLYTCCSRGVVFTAGQLALLDLLERRRALPGLQRGVELVLRDERWHIGFGASALLHAGARQSTIASLEGEARTSVGAWGRSVTPQLADHVLTLHRRRLGAAGLASGAATAAPGAAYWAA